MNNPDYVKLAQIAYDTVLKVMQEGEKKHGVDGWKDKSIDYHKLRAFHHTNSAIEFNTGDDDIAHALTRCTMIKYLETR